MKAQPNLPLKRAYLSLFLSVSLLLLNAYWAFAQKQITPDITEARINYFTGEIDTTWFNASNWSAAEIPQPTDHVVLDSGVVVCLGDSDGSSNTTTPMQTIQALTICSASALHITDQNTAPTALLIGNQAGADTVLHIGPDGTLKVESNSDYAVRLYDDSNELMVVEGRLELLEGKGIGINGATEALPVNRQIYTDSSSVVFGLAADHFQTQTYGNLILNLIDTLVINESITIHGDLTINSGTFAFIEGEITGVHSVVYGNLYIRNDAFVRTCMPHVGFNTFTLHGDIDVDESAWFSSTAGMFMELDSDDPQWLCESITLLRKLKVKGTGDKVLSADLEVTDSLVLEDGVLDTDGHTVTIGTGPDHIGTLVLSDGTAFKQTDASPTVQNNGKGRVKGKMTRWIPANKTKTLKFPVASTYQNRDVEITITTADEGGRLSVEFNEYEPGTNGLPVTDKDGKKIKDVVEGGYWTIEPVSGLTGCTYSVELVFSNNRPVSSPQNLRVVKRPDSSFEWEAPGEHADGYINSSGEYVARRTNLSGFSDFTIAVSEDEMLPVTLTSFEAILAGSNQPELTWKTSTEKENYGFHIERKKLKSIDTTWTKIAFVSGNGTTTSGNLYRYKDHSVTESGTYIYRLIQEDFDGKRTVYGPVSLIIPPEKHTCIATVSPNPFNPVTNITIKISEQSRVSLAVYNMLGQLVTTLIDQQMMPGTYPVAFNAQTLSSGNYLIVLRSEGVQQSRMITMVK